MHYVEIQAKSPNAHQRIQDWRRANQHGYIVNFRSSNDAVLHRCICQHLGDTEWEEGRNSWGSMGNTTKILSVSKDCLAEWAIEKPARLKVCSDCRP